MRQAHTARSALCDIVQLVVLAWRLLTRGKDYAWVRPALQARKLRSLELRAGLPRRHGQRGAAYDYNIKGLRQRERQAAEGAEAAYRRLTDAWVQAGPRRQRARTGAAKEERRS